MNSEFDVIVVGGGIAGMSTAYHLVAAGAHTLLLDRADPGQATAAGAGILSPESSHIQAESWFDFALHAVDYYPTLVAQLKAAGASDTGYTALHELIVAVSEDEDTPFAETLERLKARQQSHNRPAPEDMELMDSDAARALFPMLAPLRHAVHLKRAGRVDGRLLLAAMRHAALGHELMIQSADVTGLALDGTRATGVVIKGGETLSADKVVIAGGAWSGTFGEQLQVNLPVEPQRGQIIHLALPDVDTSTLPIVTAFHGHYIVPWADHRIVVGATRETGSGFVPHTTVTGVRQVLDEALRVAPGLANASIADIRVGLRPATPDFLPLLGATPTIENVLLATGHGPTGLTLGPYSGKIIADLAMGKPAEVSLEPFDVMRFGSRK